MMRISIFVDVRVMHHPSYEVACHQSSMPIRTVRTCFQVGGVYSGEVSTPSKQLDGFSIAVAVKNICNYIVKKI